MALTAQQANQHEGVLDAVRHLVMGPCISATQVGDAGGNVYSRTDFQHKLETLQKLPTFKDLAGKLSFSANAANAAGARNDFAQFLCLYDLAPFSVSVRSADALEVLLNARSDVAEKWQKFSDNFRDKWLQSRREIRRHLIQTNDLNGGALRDALFGDAGEMLNTTNDWSLQCAA